MDTTRTPNGDGQQRPPPTPEQIFAARVSQTAQKQLVAILGTEDGKKAAHTITMAMLSAMRTAKDPSSFLRVTDASIAGCVSTSWETKLYPGGPNPTVYLVPQAPRREAQPELQWRITHRGLAILAARAGFGILAVPVATSDKIRVSFGEAIEHEADPSAWPGRLEDLQGCILVVRRLSDGLIIARPWMPLAAIEKRRAKSRDGSVWAEWGVEQAQKTIIKWAFARGYVPLDSLEMQAAIQADNTGEIVDTTATTVAVEPRGAAARVKEHLALPDGGGAPVPDYRAEADRLNQREAVDVEAAPYEDAPPAAPPQDDEPDTDPTRRPRGYAQKLRGLGWRDVDMESMSPALMRRIIAEGLKADAWTVTTAGDLFQRQPQGK